MEIIQYYHHRGHIDEISSRYPCFSKLKHAKIEAAHLKWQNERGAISYHAQVAFFGKSGYGKSTTVNAFLGKAILETSDTAACTRECQSLDFELSTGCYLSLADFPGIGESEYRDAEYLKMYADFFRQTSVVVYIVRADMRGYSVDESAYQRLFKTDAERKKVIFALNCCDKIEPINRGSSLIPSEDQLWNIAAKISSVNTIFLPHNLVIPYSAETGWNMEKLAKAIVKVVSNSNDLMLSSRHGGWQGSPPSRFD
jgi:predicted GTPase